MKPAALAQLAFIALAALAVYLFVGAAQDGEARSACTALCTLAPQYANVDRAAPDFELPDLAGRKIKLSSFRGRSVILNFWTKTCKPCLDEMASLDELAEIMHNEGVGELVTVSTDQSADDARATLQTILGHEPHFVALVDPESSVVAGKFGTKLYPETWFVDPNGTIRVRVDGGRDWSSALVLDVAKMIARPNGCAIGFERGRPRGDRFAVCGDVPGGSLAWGTRASPSSAARRRASTLRISSARARSAASSRVAAGASSTAVRAWG